MKIEYAPEYCTCLASFPSITPLSDAPSYIREHAFTNRMPTSSQTKHIFLYKVYSRMTSITHSLYVTALI